MRTSGTLFTNSLAIGNVVEPVSNDLMREVSLKTRKKITLVDTQPVTVEGVRHLLDSAEGLSFGASLANLDLAMHHLRRENPDVLLVDKALGLQAILEFLAAIQPWSQAAIVVWGTSISEPEALRLLQNGVRGIARKTADPETLIRCLTTVASGHTWMEDTVFPHAHRSERGGRTELTARETEVMHLVEQGLKNKEIGRALGIRPGTVKIHLKHIFEKTGVRGRYGLALSGLRERGVVPEIKM
jgi:two-component system, NarL family, nitrate/nitrite response regulator NarL